MGLSVLAFMAGSYLLVHEHCHPSHTPSSPGRHILYLIYQHPQRLCGSRSSANTDFKVTSPWLRAIEKIEHL